MVYKGHLISNNKRFLVGKKFDRLEITDFSSKNKQNKHSQEDLGNHFDFLLADSGLCLKNPNLVLSEPIGARKLTTVKLKCRPDRIGHGHYSKRRHQNKVEIQSEA